MMLPEIDIKSGYENDRSSMSIKLLKFFRIIDEVEWIRLSTSYGD